MSCFIRHDVDEGVGLTNRDTIQQNPGAHVCTGGSDYGADSVRHGDQIQEGFDMRSSTSLHMMNH